MVIRLKKLLAAALGAVLILLGILFLLFTLCGVESRANSQESAAEIQTDAAIRQIDPEQPMIALTFDDGPHTPVTMRILSALEAVGGRATFFVVGDRIAGREDTVRAVAEAGCELGNHTFSHKMLRGCNVAQIKEELAKTDAVLLDTVGETSTVVRPPGGAYDKMLLSVLEKPAVLWTVDTMDWSHQNAETTVQRVLEHAKDGDIVLMHDLFMPTAEAAEILIPELTKRGFQLVTVSELLFCRENPNGILQTTVDKTDFMRYYSTTLSLYYVKSEDGK